MYVIIFKENNDNPYENYNNYTNYMVASVSFVSTGAFNHVFSSLPMHTLLSSKFPREI
jgi:hypothetical protein